MVAPYETENGWQPRYAGDDILNWVHIPGAEHVQMQYMKGWPTSILRAYAADYHAYIEPLRNADSASYTSTNSVSTSNHLNGTAQDLNWNDHAFRVSYAGYDDAKIARMRELLQFYNYKGVQVVWWAQDWDSPKDSMHHQMGYKTWNNPIVGEFIAKFIRADGFSTFRRGGDIPAPLPTNNATDVLARATGLSWPKAQEVLPAVLSGLRESQCNNVNRIAMWLAQVGHESVSFQYTEEIDKNGRYAPYIGRTWIQITWDYNYRAFSEWCFGKGLVTSPDYFVVNYRELADLKWAGIGAAWYWTVARPKINAMSDARDLVGVTQAINGGQNGADDRARRYERALALGDQLLALTVGADEGEDDLSAEAERKIDLIWEELSKHFVSESPFRPFGDEPAGTLAKFALWTDGSVHWQAVQNAAKLGHHGALQLLEYVALRDKAQYPDRADDIDLANAVLAELHTPPSTPAATPVKLQTVELQADQPKVFYPQPGAVYSAPVPAPVPTPIAAPTGPETVGQIIGRAYDALEALQLSGALTDAEKAPLAALIGVLQTKTQGE